MLYVVGIGPGNEDYFTKEAENALNSTDLIVCYTGYKKYVERFDKEIYVSGMTKELERVEYALNEAENKAREEYLELQKTEELLINSLTSKYGDGSLNLKDGTSVKVDIAEMLADGEDPDFIERLINDRLNALDDYIQDVDFHISVESVAKVVQPFTDNLLKNL